MRVSSGRWWPVSKYWWGDEPRVMIPVAIFPQLTAGLPAARAFGALAMRADNHTGLVTSTYEQIAADAGMSRGQAAAGLSKLIELGWVEQVRKGRQHVPSRYRVRATTTPSSPETRTPDVPSSPETKTPDDDQQSGNPDDREAQESGNPDSAVRESGPSLVSLGLSSTTSTSSLISARVRKALAEAAPDLTDDDEIAALIEKIARKHPNVRNLAAWLFTVGRNGDLAALIEEMRHERTAGPQMAEHLPVVLPECARCGARQGEPVAVRYFTNENGQEAKCPCRTTGTADGPQTATTAGMAASRPDGPFRGQYGASSGYVNQTDRNIAMLLAGGSTSPKRNGYQGWRSPANQDVYDEELYPAATVDQSAYDEPLY